MKNLIYLITLVSLVTFFTGCEKEEAASLSKKTIEVDSTELLKKSFVGTWKTVLITKKGVQQNFTRNLLITEKNANGDFGNYDLWNINNDNLIFTYTPTSYNISFNIISYPKNTQMKLKFNFTDGEYEMTFQKQ